MLNKKRILIIAGIVLAIILLFWAFGSEESEKKKNVETPVRYGDFDIKVFTTGELEAENSVEVQGPKGLRSAGIWRVQISDIVEEGKRVKKGEYIATLDKSEISNKISDAKSEMQKAESQFIQVKLDTTLELRKVRDEIKNLRFQVKEKKITVDQSKYEPPATIRQAKLELEKARNRLEQELENYQIKVDQSKAKMQESLANLSKAESFYNMLTSLVDDFTILAPENGMVIYEREWSGKKKGAGSEISAWDPTVATLPDLSSMVSKTYVNEVDIRKVKEGQQVDITLDAFPEKKLTGNVTSVANVGQELPQTDAKVFEVVIKINETDTVLRPGMTTGNSIITDHLEDVLYVPLESVYGENDSLTFVYRKDGWGVSKQEVVTGAADDNFIVVKEGLEKGNIVLLSVPDKHEDLELQTLAATEE